jgi:large subunit ribosomal protein L9
VKVVFLEDVTGTARIGDIKDVKTGFARNYLLPRRLAMAATPSVIKSAEARAARETRLQDARDMDARAVAARVEAAPLSFTVKAGSTGKLFGSVGSADIATKIGESLGSEFDRHNVVLADPIKELGDYQIPVKLTKNVIATVSVSVIGEDGTTAADIKARTSGGAEASVAEAATSDEDDATAGDDAVDEADLEADAVVDAGTDEESPE